MYAKIAASSEPKSSVSEAYRTLRTNIQFSSVDENMKTIVVTSSVSGEGKTTTACNLATMIASGGHKTILIDCDMRRPNVHKMFGISNNIGLSDLRISSTKLAEVVLRTEVENLFVLCSGATIPNPADFLASKIFNNLINELKEQYEYIIIDTPPVIPVTDAQIVAQHADGCLLVVLAGEAHRSIVLRAKQLLLKVNAKMIGTVLNSTDASMGGYFYNSYKNYNDNYGNKSIKRASAWSIFAGHN